MCQARASFCSLPNYSSSFKNLVVLNKIRWPKNTWRCPCGLAVIYFPYFQVHLNVLQLVYLGTNPLEEPWWRTVWERRALREGQTLPGQRVQGYPGDLVCLLSTCSYIARLFRLVWLHTEQAKVPSGRLVIKLQTASFGSGKRESIGFKETFYFQSGISHNIAPGCLCLKCFFR